jgi:hypothetical protein
MAQTPFSSEEQWSEIRDFLGYSVSNRGRVMNVATGFCMTPTKKQNSGLLMVGLMKNGVQYKRSLTLLVAREFVPPHPNEKFDTPINLNGDRADNQSTNLMWRPLWFAREYNKQFTDDHATYDFPIEDVETGIMYKDSYSAAIEHGLLEHEIVMSMANNTYVWPTCQIFREAIDR